MRILPRSLFGRLTLVLLVGLVLAQLLSASILLRDRGQTLYRSVRADLVERTAGIVRLLDALAPVERRRLLPLLSTPETRIRLTDAPADAQPTGVEEDSVTVAVERALRERLPAHQEVRVALWDAALAERPSPGMAAMHRRHMMGHEDPGPWAYLRGVAISAGGFLIQARLDDGSWVQFERRIPDSLFDRPTRLLLTLAVLLVSVVVLALLAVRWVVRPLRALRQAAEELGRDIRRAPLPDTGPLEVRETARAFNTMQQRIRSFVEDRSRILAAISHDLKTPLTRLRLRSDLLEDEDLRDRIHADLDDMETMVSATLDFMRSSEGHEESRQLDLTALLESIRDDARDAGWNVSLTGAVTAPIRARPMALKRCITNLVENGVRYGGEVEVVVEDDGRQVRIDVQDRGPGIPSELTDKVFDPFFRIESSRARHTGGTGLGLGIARNIARAHGGDLTLHDRDGGGLRAELTLPR